MNEGDGSSDEPREPETKKAEAPAKADAPASNGSEKSSPSGNSDEFVTVTKAQVDTVTRFIIEHVDEIKTSNDAFGYIKQQFEGRGIKAKNFGELLANKGNRQALLNFLQEQYGEVPKI